MNKWQLRFSLSGDLEGDEGASSKRACNNALFLSCFFRASWRICESLRWCCFAKSSSHFGIVHVFLTALFSISWRNGGISKLFAFLFIVQTRPMYYNKHRNRFSHTKRHQRFVLSRRVREGKVRLEKKAVSYVWKAKGDRNERCRKDVGLADEFSRRIARNTQLYLQEETGICRTIDPWAGSYYVETLTNELMKRAWVHIEEIESLGGMAKAIETGIPKMRIEEAAARRQARIDSGAETIIGVNKYRPDKEEPIDILEVDNTAVRKRQIERLNELKATRDSEQIEAALAAITKAAETGEGNLLELAVQAARVRATLGEISYAIEKVASRHRAAIRSISGVYSSEYKNEIQLERVKRRVEQFAELEGRRPRILIAKMGQDGHDRGAKVVATAFADLGFDVDIGPLFQTPEETARQAVENDVHAVGISSLAGEHKTLVPQLVAELEKIGRGDILVFVGGVIPPQDYAFLYEHGAAASSKKTGCTP